MNYNHIIHALKILGQLLMPFSLTMLPPLIVTWIYKESTTHVFLSSTIATFVLGIILWFPFRKLNREIHGREGFLIVALLWVALSFMGALPFLISHYPTISFVDALFETVSGLTTTGTTVFSNLDTMPRSLIYYRSQLQFVGGGGIILLGIAILPMLSVGGMQLFRAEMTGPFKEERLAPRITQTAKMLWVIYVGLNLLCILSFWMGGMSFFDAVAHGFGAISTGGFGTHDDSFAHFHHPILELLGIFFMMVGAINFSLHFYAAKRGTFRHYWQDLECRTYLILWLAVSALVALTLIYYHIFEKNDVAIIKSLLNF